MAPTSVPPPPASVSRLLSAVPPVLHPIARGRGRGQARAQAPDLVTLAAAAATLQPAVAAAAAATLEAVAAATPPPQEAAVVAMPLHQPQVCYLLTLVSCGC